MEKSLFGGKQNETGLSTDNFRKISNAFYLVFTGMIRKSLLCITCFFKETRSRISRAMELFFTLKGFEMLSNGSCLIYLLKISTVPFGGKFSPDFPR